MTKYSPKRTLSKGARTAGYGAIGIGIGGTIMAFLRSQGWALWDASMDLEYGAALSVLIAGASKALINWWQESG